MKRRPGESVDDLLRRFKRAVIREGILLEYRSRTAYMKPGERKRKKHDAAVRRINGRGA